MEDARHRSASLVILVTERQRQVNFCEIKVNLLYIGSSRTDETTERSCLKTNRNKTQEENVGIIYT